MRFTSFSNRRWRTLSLTALLALVLGLLLSACGDATATPAASTTAAATTSSTTAAASTTAASTTQAAAASNGNVTTVTFWGDWGGEGEKQFTAMVDAFNKTRKDIQVKYVLQEDMITKFLTAATSGGSPDIMFWDRWRTSLYAPKGVLMPIDELMARDKVSKDDFYQEALRELSNGGKLYGLPLTVDARGLFYNKKLLSEAGVEPPKTWEELAVAARKLTKWNGDKLERAGFSLQDVGLFNMYMQQAGGQILSADGTKTNFNNEKGQAVLNYWDRLLNKDKVYQVGFEEGLGKDQDAFVTGKTAMLYTGPWMISTYKKYGKDLDFGIVPPPAGPNGDKGSVMGGFGLVIPKASKNQQAAWEFMKWWLAQPENALLWAKTSYNIPGNLKAIQDPFFQNDPFWKPILETLQFAKVRPTIASYSPMEVDGLIPNLQLFVQGKQNIQQTLQKAQEQGDKLLVENSLK